MLILHTAADTSVFSLCNFSLSFGSSWLRHTRLDSYSAEINDVAEHWSLFLKKKPGKGCTGVFSSRNSFTVKGHLLPRFFLLCEWDEGWCGFFFSSYISLISVITLRRSLFALLKKCPSWIRRDREVVEKCLGLPFFYLYLLSLTHTRTHQLDEKRSASTF